MKYFLIACALVVSSLNVHAYPLWNRLTQQTKEDVALFLWFNESGATRDGLTEWNVGEDFLSIGYGHMLWIPDGTDPGYVDTFPSFLQQFYDRPVFPSPPRWIVDLGEHPKCPWKTRTEFLKSFNEPRTRELRDWLYNTRSEQARFYVERLENSLEAILVKLGQWSVTDGSVMIESLVESQLGIVVLVDYVNFKGEGLNKDEVRNSTPWGLSRALYWMSRSHLLGLEGLSKGAADALRERVGNAALDGRDEKRWLDGWLVRVDRYKDPETVLAPLRGHL